MSQNRHRRGEKMKIEEHWKWVYDHLESWCFTFQDEAIDEETGKDENVPPWETLNKLLLKISKQKRLSKNDYENIIFYLWQKVAFDEVEE